MFINKRTTGEEKKQEAYRESAANEAAARSALHVGWGAMTVLTSGWSPSLGNSLDPAGTGRKARLSGHHTLRQHSGWMRGRWGGGVDTDCTVGARKGP